MVALPELAEVQAILDQAPDSDGVSLVVLRPFSVNLEDSRGRKFGSGQMLLPTLLPSVPTGFATPLF